MDLFSVALYAPAIWFALRFPAAAQAFDVPPTNSAAALYRKSALAFFFAGAALFLTASLLDALANARAVGEVFGWCGIGCADVCLLCGVRYAAVNKTTHDSNWYQA